MMTVIAHDIAKERGYYPIAFHPPRTLRAETRHSADQSRFPNEYIHHRRAPLSERLPDGSVRHRLAVVDPQDRRVGIHPTVSTASHRACVRAYLGGDGLTAVAPLARVARRTRATRRRADRARDALWRADHRRGGPAVDRRGRR